MQIATVDVLLNVERHSGVHTYILKLYECVCLPAFVLVSRYQLVGAGGIILTHSNCVNAPSTPDIEALYGGNESLKKNSTPELFQYY